MNILCQEKTKKSYILFIVIFFRFFLIFSLFFWFFMWNEEWESIRLVRMKNREMNQFDEYFMFLTYFRHTFFDFGYCLSSPAKTFLFSGIFRDFDLKNCSVICTFHLSVGNLMHLLYETEHQQPLCTLHIPNSKFIIKNSSSK